MDLPPASRAFPPANLTATFKRGAPSDTGLNRTAAALTVRAPRKQAAGFTQSSRTGPSAIPKRAGGPRAKLTVHRSIRAGC